MQKSWIEMPPSMPPLSLRTWQCCQRNAIKGLRSVRCRQRVLFGAASLHYHIRAVPSDHVCVTKTSWAEENVMKSLLKSCKSKMTKWPSVSISSTLFNFSVVRVSQLFLGGIYYGGWFKTAIGCNLNCNSPSPSIIILYHALPSLSHHKPLC